MDTEAMRDEVRRAVAAVTATLADDSAARLEAAELLRPRHGSEIGDVLVQYNLTLAMLLTITAGMTALAGKLQAAYSGEEILQQLALAFEERWLQP